MRVHHLNCGSMRIPTSAIVCHVLLIEASDRLVLVDTGFGLQDIERPSRIGPSRHLLRPALQPGETALHQVRALGYDERDVRDILMTHLDVDHAGGLADFPDAQVHVSSAEALGAIWSPSVKERQRYRAQQWAHDPHLVEHDITGEAWRGFAAAKPLDEVADGIVMIALPGHSRGHTAFAVESDHGWILHAGDSFYHHSVLDGRDRAPRILASLERFIAFDLAQVRHNHQRLTELHQHDQGLIIVNAHDPILLDRARTTSSAV
ncbi:MBL fold metallo-hydrolase [Streptomyces sp. NPDC002623]